MHELSIIHSIISGSEQALRKQGEGHRIEFIDLEIGELAGVEISTLEFLWPAAVSETCLSDAACRIHRVSGQALCGVCGARFGLTAIFDPCPECGQYLKHIEKGEELRIKSLTLIA